MVVPESLISTSIVAWSMIFIGVPAALSVVDELVQQWLTEDLNSAFKLAPNLESILPSHSGVIGE